MRNSQYVWVTAQISKTTHREHKLRHVDRLGRERVSRLPLSFLREKREVGDDSGWEFLVPQQWAYSHGFLSGPAHDEGGTHLQQADFNQLEERIAALKTAGHAAVGFNLPPLPPAFAEADLVKDPTLRRRDPV